MYLRPALGEKDLPHRTKLRAETLSRANSVEKKISEVFKEVNIFYGLCEGAFTNEFVAFRMYQEKSHLPSTPGLPRLVTHTFQ